MCSIGVRQNYFQLLIQLEVEKKIKVSFNEKELDN